MHFIFLHGGGQGGWTWDETIAALHLQAPGEHQALVLDVPGCGTKRDRDTSAIAFADIVDELFAEIVAAGVSGGVLVGHSQAGTVLPALIARQPALFARTIYVSCVAPVAGMDVIGTVLMMNTSPEGPLHGLFGNPDVAPRDLWRQMFCNDMGAAEAEHFLDRLGLDQWPASAVAATDWTYDHLEGQPSTYVLCLEDRSLTPDAQEAFASRFQCERVVRIDAGHQVQNTCPHGLAEILRRDAAPPA